MPPLRLQNVCKRFGLHQALADVNLDFPKASFTAIIGRSGCGKSTLLEMCNGLVQPDSGTVEALGAPLDYQQLTNLRRKIGYAVQGTGLFPHLSVADNITLLAKLEQWQPSRIEQRLQQLMALMQLHPDQLHKYPQQLSGGQQQRVGLCRAMMLQPEILLLDEPFAAIDPITRGDIQGQLAALHLAEPTTTILVTHDMAEAMLLADRVVVMHEGQVTRVEATAELLRNFPGRPAQEVLLALMPGPRS